MSIKIENELRPQTPQESETSFSSNSSFIPNLPQENQDNCEIKIEEQEVFEGFETPTLSFEETSIVKYPFIQSSLHTTSLGEACNESTGIYVCSFCNVEISEKKYYGRHIKWCARNYLIMSKQEEFTTKVKRKFNCDKCSYSAKNNYNLQRHALVHTDRKQFRCVICNKSFRRNSPLRDHIKTHNTNREKNVLCPYCKNTYHRKSALTRHIQVKHSDLIKFKCDLCEYTTIDEIQLKKHISSKHTDFNKKYECDHCDYFTENKGHMKTHLRIHTNLKPFKCNFKICKCLKNIEKLCECECKPCNFETAHEVNLKKHVLQKHSNETKKYKCSDCCYSTHIKADFTTHLRIHTNEKPFSCGYPNCEYKSTRREHLKIHIRHKHTKEKPFRCEMCDYSCVSSCNLKRHVIKHNN